MKKKLLQIARQHEDLIFCSLYFTIIAVLVWLTAKYCGTVDEIPGWL